MVNGNPNLITKSINYRIDVPYEKPSCRSTSIHSAGLLLLLLVLLLPELNLCKAYILNLKSVAFSY